MKTDCKFNCTFVRLYLACTWKNFNGVPLDSFSAIIYKWLHGALSLVAIRSNSTSTRRRVIRLGVNRARTAPAAATERRQGTQVAAMQSLREKKTFR